ncbi:MAG TPA: ABC transporter ATP-binding protein [Baekduia sp.]|nr:ABC transporter ATP-binding protein [Baekduia sp.]
MTNATTLLQVENLRVAFGATDVVKGVSFSVQPGRCLAIVGESGSGKSVTARTLVGLTGGRSQVTADRLEFDGRDLRGLGDRAWRRLRGRDVGFVLQDALVSLDQLRPVGKEIAEALRLHGWGTRAERRARVLELLHDVGIPEPELRVRQLPHELSGGQRQRALIAAAIALDPKLIIADEPTTALDVTVQARILQLLEEIRERGSALILISHDLAVVGRMADEVAVMRDGEIVEHGDARDVLSDPQHEYTRALLDAIPTTHTRGTRLSPGTAPATTSTPAPAVTSGRFVRRAGADRVPVLEVQDIVKRFSGPDGATRTVVDRVSFSVGPGETLGVVGESGSGKTTSARIALALLEPEEGRVLLNGEPWSGLPEKERRARRRQISVIYQDPLSSFDPRWSVERILADSLPVDAFSDDRARRARVGQLLEQVGLGDEHRDRRPLQLSGGQRQRVAIARALGPEPSIIVCDEPVSALDVSIQAQVLDLLTDLQRELGVSYLFISHDLGVIHHMSDRVLVLNEGQVVETGDADAVFRNPRKAYTRRLLAALPRLERRDTRPVEPVAV